MIKTNSNTVLYWLCENRIGLQYRLPSVLTDGSEAKKELGFSPECQLVGLKPIGSIYSKIRQLPA